METVALTISIIVWSSIKYAFGVGIALYSNIGLLPSFALTVGGGMFGILFFTFFGSLVKKVFHKYFWHRRLRINRRTRFLVKVKNKWGLPGIAFLTPILLSIPVGVFLATALSSNKRQIFTAMFVSLVFWALIFFIPYYAFGIDIQAFLKDIIFH